jgi:hypothetical protein
VKDAVALAAAVTAARARNTAQQGKEAG